MLGALTAGLGLAQGVLGLGQMVGGMLQKKPEIPEYDIPQEYYQNMSEAEYQSFIGLPEAQKREYIDNVQRGVQTALAGSTSRKGGLGIVSQAAQGATDAAKHLLSADAAARQENMDKVFQMRDALGQQKGIKQSWKRDKVMEKRARIDEMRGAGLQNVMSSLGSLIGIEGESGGLTDLFKKKNTATTATKPTV